MEEHKLSLTRRGVLGAAIASVAFAVARPLGAAPPRPVRLRWPWPVHLPDPHSSSDIVAALVCGTLFPPLYVRAIDGLLEPRLAIGAPHETKVGLRVDLPAWIRQSDVVASISAAKAGGARLALKELPVPRLEGLHGVLFPGLQDIDSLVRKLATPLAGIARFEPRRIGATGIFDLALEEKEATRVLRLTRRPLAAMPGVPVPPANRALQRFELEGPLELGSALRSFERGESEISWVADGLFAPRPGARPIDLGALAYLAVRAGRDAPDLLRPGAVLGIVESLAHDRLGHLGLLRRGHCTTPSGGMPSTKVPRGIPILVRASAPAATLAVEILAREIDGVPQPVDSPTFDRAMSEGRFSLAVDVVRAIDESSDGAAVALATFDRAANAPPNGLGPRGVALGGSAALGWEIALIGAEAPSVWIPRAPFGGFDLESAADA